MIEVKGLTKYYGATRAISDLSFSIEKGETIGFLGLNGAGKSTALKILAGVLLPTAGTVIIEGVDMITSPRKIKARIGFLPETPPLYHDMTVRGFLCYLARLRGMSASRAKARTRDVIALTALEIYADSLIETLSLGYRKRLGIAQAIVHEPALVILDEPISGLDPVQIVQVRELVQRLRGEHTVLIASHNLPEVQKTCSRLLVLRDGKLVVSGTEAELRTMAGGVSHRELRARGTQEEVRAASTQVSGVENLVLVRQDDGVGTWTLRASDEACTELVAALIGANIGVLHLSQTRDELERAFLQLVQQGGAL